MTSSIALSCPSFPSHPHTHTHSHHPNFISSLPFSLHKYFPCVRPSPLLTPLHYLLTSLYLFHLFSPLRLLLHPQSQPTIFLSIILSNCILISLADSSSRVLHLIYPPLLASVLYPHTSISSTLSLRHMSLHHFVSPHFLPYHPLPLPLPVSSLSFHLHFSTSHLTPRHHSPMSLSLSSYSTHTPLTRLSSPCH